MNKYIEIKNGIDDNKIQEIAEEMVKGKIVVFPTETVYGIGTNGLNSDAIEKIYKIKKRPYEKPISLLVSSIEMVEQVAKDITELEYKIMEKFFPGPITIVLKKKPIVPNRLTANTDVVGVRMPEGEFARKLVEYAKTPIAATSANISGEESGIEAKAILEKLPEGIDVYVDEGKSKIGIASTVVQVVENEIVIIREGIISKKEIEEKL